jgi:hypothetical protein
MDAGMAAVLLRGEHLRRRTERAGERDVGGEAGHGITLCVAHARRFLASIRLGVTETGALGRIVDVGRETLRTEYMIE